MSRTTTEDYASKGGIVRSARRTNFTVIDNAVVHSNLSWQATGLLTYVLTKPDHWRVSVRDLIKHTAKARKSTGRDGVYAILDELIDTGFVQRIKAMEDGFMHTVYVVHDRPISPSNPLPDNPEVAGNPLPANPDPANPDPANPDAIVKTEKAVSTDALERTDSPLPPKGDVPSFDDFWLAYPKKRKKPDAEKAFAKLKPTAELMERIMSALAIHKRQVEWAKDKGQFIPYPASWLNGRRWEDEIGEEIGGARDAAGNAVAITSQKRSFQDVDYTRGAIATDDDMPDWARG